MNFEKIKSISGAFLLWIPLFILLYNFPVTKDYVGKQNQWNLWESVKNFNSFFIQDFQSDFPFWGPFFWIVPILGTVFYFFPGKGSTKCGVKKQVTILSLSALITPLLVSLIFDLKINWQLKHRYIIIVLPLFYMITAIS